MGAGRVANPETLDCVIVALCRDFSRRERGSAVRRVDMEYKYLNTRMLEAAGEIVGERYARLMIEEIGERIGYAKTALEYVSESEYKRKKIEVKRSIAEHLYLIG